MPHAGLRSVSLNGQHRRYIVVAPCPIASIKEIGILRSCRRRGSSGHNSISPLVQRTGHFICLGWRLFSCKT